MGLSCPHTRQKSFRTPRPLLPSLHHPPWASTVCEPPGILSPDNLTHLGLGLENFLRICFVLPPPPPLATTALRSGVGTAPGRGATMLRSPTASSAQGPALWQMRRVEERAVRVTSRASGGTRWLRFSALSPATGIPAGI